MPRLAITPELTAKILRVYAETKSCRQTADRCGCSTGPVLKIVREHGGGKGEVESSSGGSENEEYRSVASHKPIKTLAEAVDAAGVDLNVWLVDRWECVAWSTPMKVSKGQDKDGRWQAEKPIQTQQYRVKVWLKRIMPKAINDAHDAIYARMGKYAPKYPSFPKAKKSAAETFLAVLGLFDVHFGKLCWQPETGDNYDLKAAENIFRNAVDDMIAESGGRTISRFLLPIGNDFYHLDNSRNMTFAGTPQDVDGRYAKVIEAGEMAVIWAIERLMPIAPVSVVWVPGNHDPTTSYHLARFVAAWFRNTDRVSVDAGPSPRKYVQWESTLLGLTHGNEEKHEQLPTLMATEKPQAWAGATCHEWLLGHMHRSRQWVTKPIDTHGGVTVRVLQSLSGTDAWHHRKAFVSTKHSAEVLFYGRDRGYAGHAVVPARV